MRCITAFWLKKKKIENQMSKKIDKNLKDDR